MARIAPPWIKTAASRNIAKRARAATILKRNGVPRMSKAEARDLCHHATTGRPAIDPAPPYPGVRPGGIADRAMQIARKPR